MFTRKQAEATGMAWSTLARMAKDGVAERVAHGVYRLRGNARESNLDVCAAWMQLAPKTMVWERAPEQGVLCRWSAAAAYGLSHAASGIHQFTFPDRRQSRRRDVKLYKASLGDGEVARIGGLMVTTPARMVADLLGDGEDLLTVARIAADALCEAKTSRPDMAVAIAPHAARIGFAAHDGLSLLDWLLGHTTALQETSAVAASQLTEVPDGQQFLRVNEHERSADETDGTTVRLTTVMRQARSRRGARISLSER